MQGVDLFLDVCLDAAVYLLEVYLAVVVYVNGAAVFGVRQSFLSSA